jgi:hypothetical protein
VNTKHFQNRLSYDISNRGRSQRGCSRRTAPARQAPWGRGRSPEPYKTAPPCGGGLAHWSSVGRRKRYCVAESYRFWRRQPSAYPPFSSFQSAPSTRLFNSWQYVLPQESDPSRSLPPSFLRILQNSWFAYRSAITRSRPK